MALACRTLHGPMRGGACQQHRAAGSRRVAAARPSSASRQLSVVARAERGSDSSFLSGFVMGGVVFGTLGFLFAPQISRALLGDDHRLRLPRFMEEEMPKDPEATKQDLIDKIAQLNASIDEVAATLKGKDVEVVTAELS
ncbi:MAG: hypothetical protein J3K34DRAFT_464813 [Monoraphidium minutum]|nr:MAG: hypothetical protein J3K34DRAFT_464813 [Monoraphidium minutum]